jgi:hypothetical protein
MRGPRIEGNSLLLGIEPGTWEVPLKPSTIELKDLRQSSMHSMELELNLLKLDLLLLEV